MAKKTKSRRAKGSDDDSDSSETHTSIASDSTLFSDSTHDVVEATMDELNNELTNIMEKRQETREAGLRKLCSLLHSPQPDWLAENRDAISLSLARSLSRGAEEEAILAMRVLVPVLLSIVEAEESRLIREWHTRLTEIAKFKSEEVRSQALQLLAFLSVVGEPGMANSVLELCTKTFAEEGNSPNLVATSLQCWGVVIGSLSPERIAAEHYTGAVHLFVELLEGDNVDVRIACGANLALLTDLMKQVQDAPDSVEDTAPGLPDMFEDLKRECAKKHSKKDRARQRAVFRAVEQTLGGGDSPSEKLVLAGNQVEVRNWPQIFILDLLRAVLRSGFQLHVLGYGCLQAALGIRIVKYSKPSTEDKEFLRMQSAQNVKARSNLRDKNRRKKNEYANHQVDSD